MATEVILPKMGQTMEEGTILEWYKAEGQEVDEGEPLFQVESDKAVFDIESPASGTLRQVWFPSGATVSVLAPVAIIGSPEEDLSGYKPPAAAKVPEAPLPFALAPEEPSAPPPSRAGGRVPASPRARRLAREKGIELARVTGTGPQGSIVEQDVLDYLKAHPEGRGQPRTTPTARKLAAQEGVELTELTGTGPGGRVTRADVRASLAEGVAATVGEVVPLTGTRKLIAQRMAESARTTARLTLTTEADVTELVGLVKRFRELLEGQDAIPGYNDLFLKAVAQALQDHPYLNARWGEEGIELLSEINIGLAVDTERGLVVPVIEDVPSKGLREIARERRDLTDRALADELLPDDLTGGTFTITNLGMFEIDAFAPLINLPECAILGAGRIRAKPALHRGEICARQMMALSLTFDHRVVDGAPAARFLQQVKRLIEQPSLLLL
ncbi:MAG: dihydrolipoamide acetyltransferase family protein [Chloroflexota bacterium]|nr:dihydrolipoamide acetyltransferase family protein [Chloroflexota bacterium]